jgi:two-component system alkaline phosphatase synthesis response regulator PhoP
MRVLVVEDDRAIALALEDDLKLEGFAVDVVGDGEAAVERAQGQAFHLILLDIMLPKKDGFEVCRELRKTGVRTPIIVLTARTEEAEKVMGLEIGADDYITKPYSPRELRARIKAVLRRATGELPELYGFGDMEVDFIRREVRRAGALVEFSPLEFKLLAAFIRHAGRVLSRDQLLDEVWGRGTFLSDRVVDNQVANLRKKIESPASSPYYLVSVRGVGYRFDG